MSTTTANQARPEAFPKLQPLIDYLDSLEGRADLAVLEQLLNDVNVAEADLSPVCRFKSERYQRNTIRQTEWYELVALCWEAGQRTPIHDHRASSCAFKVIKGTASETRFDRTTSGLIRPVHTKDLSPGYVCAAEDSDIHQVANAQGENAPLITLHIYSPPLRQFHRYTLDTPCVDGQETVQELVASGPDTAVSCDE